MSAGLINQEERIDGIRDLVTMDSSRYPSSDRIYTALVGADLVTAITTAAPIAAPTSWAATYGNTDSGAIPENVSVNIRPTVTAGFANDVEDVKKYAEPIHAATATGMIAVCFRADRMPMMAISPAVATTSPTSIPRLVRSRSEI